MKITNFAAGAAAGLLATLPLTATMKYLSDRRARRRFALPAARGLRKFMRRTPLRRKSAMPDYGALALLAPLALGSAAGSLYAPLGDLESVPPVVKGMAIGLVAWAGSRMGWLPALSVMPSETRMSTRRTAMTIGTYLAWGSVLGLIADRLMDGRMSKNGNGTDQAYFRAPSSMDAAWTQASTSTPARQTTMPERTSYQSTSQAMPSDGPGSGSFTSERSSYTSTSDRMRSRSSSMGGTAGGSTSTGSGASSEPTGTTLPLTTIAGLFRSWDNAAHAIDLLSTAGFGADDLTLIVPKKVADENRSGDSGVGMVAGGTTAPGTTAPGGTGNLLTGVVPFRFAGLGNIMYSGTLFGGRQGAAGTEVETEKHDLVRTLTDAGIPGDRAGLYAEGVKRGGILVAVQSRDRSAEALNLMLQANAADVEALGKEWQRSGWQGFDPNAEPGRDYPTLGGR